MGRICAFCGGGQVTAEHVWPDWLVRLFPSTSIRVERSGGHALSYTQKSIKLTVRAVCEGCNSGWMSDIENLAKPVLLPMIHGRPVRLGGPEQRAVAIWTIKTAIAFSDRHQALDFETYLKTPSGRAFAKKRL